MSDERFKAIGMDDITMTSRIMKFLIAREILKEIKG